MYATGEKYILSRRELATVLAALRFWQRHGPKNEDSFFDKIECEEQDLLDGIRTNCGKFDDLSVEEIDALCERLNTGV